MADLIKQIIANPGKFKGEIIAERGLRILNMDGEELATDYGFYTHVHEVKMVLKTKPAKTSASAAPKANKMEKKTDTSKNTESAFATNGK